MDTKTLMREGFEQQRKVGMNVDWFTWQIAWHDALFTVHDRVPEAGASAQAVPFGWAPLGGSNYFTRNESSAKRIGGLVPVYIHPAAPASDSDVRRKALTDGDVYTLIGHADNLRDFGQEDMPKYIMELAQRIAQAIGDTALADRAAALLREAGSR